jgi:hypothetical protein
VGGDGAHFLVSGQLSVVSSQWLINNQSVVAAHSEVYQTTDNEPLTTD